VADDVVEADEPPSDRRVQWGLAIGAVVVAVALALTLAGDDDDTSAPPSPTSTTIDLASVTNEELEQVVAEHPEVVAMRLRLVERYIADLDFASAQTHAEEAAVRATTVEDRSRALAYLGLTTALLGDGEAGEGLLMQSLALDPTNRDSLYYLARVRYEVLGRPDAAIGPLEQLLELELTDEQRSLIEGMLAEVQVAAAVGTTTTLLNP
jgi:cytochrome c-type biogenesis protein CcmH/NrfG